MLEQVDAYRSARRSHRHDDNRWSCRPSRSMPPRASRCGSDSAPGRPGALRAAAGRWAAPPTPGAPVDRREVRRRRDRTWDGGAEARGAVAARASAGRSVVPGWLTTTSGIRRREAAAAQRLQEEEASQLRQHPKNVARKTTRLRVPRPTSDATNSIRPSTMR